ncbi:formylglycine-generating enzyme required for sulfatase activity [Povalibacter uvarum]|uniref:Formylglycine-generating enzyme required for sulfatase activity n=1 Tax=Povalibacter uvarum TaxID=732238 RepID=A0A841HPH7_9GAMM|nr:PEGA domain-containing protein [Povalibacter uvarum]MBB6095057.1 formylglycine-generating enzyme required for sulfatase activity [Povalibacter uvarum]
MNASALQEETLIVREPQGERRFGAPDFPLGFGGAGSVVVLSGRPEGVEAWLGVHEDQLFVQPAEGKDVLHNGLRITQSAWLKAGDVVNLGNARLRVVEDRGQRTIEVDDGSAGNITAPPIIQHDARLRGDSDAEAEPIAAVRFRASEGAARKRTVTFNPTRVLLTVIALIAGGVLWFVLTATSIGVSTAPVKARIDIAGGLPAVPVGGRFLLRPGEYTIRASSPGYAPAEIKVKVTEAANQQFALSLAKLPGMLSIQVPVEAKLSIDGQEVGSAPGEFELQPGTHTVAINAPRYQPFSGTVEVEGLGKKQVFTPALVAAWANVTITSEPAGAQVIVAGEQRGVTPLTTEVMAGNQPLELRLEGFKAWTTDIQVKASEAMTVGPVRLGLPDGRLALRSEPSGASVTISGVYRGVTPLDVEVRPDMEQSIVFSRPGYEPATRQATLKSGERQTMSVALTGVYGEVAVRAQPADAQVFVDGRPAGNVNQTLRLVATTHEIEIRKAGFVDFKTTVTPRPGLPQVVETKLLTAEQTRIAATPAVVTTKVSQQLKLMPLGRFTMGSPRREPGRRANEAQRDVEFKRGFYVGVREVTNAEFKRFKSDHRSGIVPPNTLELDNQPVVNVRWEQAAAYCNWLSEQEGLQPAYVKDGESLVPANPMTNGYRLPTDAEWEWVARYSSDGKARRYPWGDALPVAPASGNYADYTARVVLQDIVPGYDDGYAVTAPVGKFPPNVLGLYDIGGNVAEWAHDYYTVSTDSTQVAVDTMGPAQGKNHVIRGSSWKQSSVTDLRLSARDFGDVQRNDVGFRVARYVQ